MSAAATHLTAGQRIAAIRERIEAATRRMPAGWENWSVDQVRTYKGRITDLRRARTLSSVQEAASQLGAYYGLALAQLDPGEVSA